MQQACPLSVQQNSFLTVLRVTATLRVGQSSSDCAPLVTPWVRGFKGAVVHETVVYNRRQRMAAWVATEFKSELQGTFAPGLILKTTTNTTDEIMCAHPSSINHFQHTSSQHMCMHAVMRCIIFTTYVYHVLINTRTVCPFQNNSRRCGPRSYVGDSHAVNRNKLFASVTRTGKRKTRSERIFSSTILDKFYTEG